MNQNERGLGRGLDALFRNIPNEIMSSGRGNENENASPRDEKSIDSIRMLPLAALSPAQGQPRKFFDGDALEELAASIRSQGVIQPLLVRPHRTETATIYEIVAGERRWRAAQLAGLTEVPVYVREMSDENALTAALIENLQREDLNPLEEAQAIQALRERLPLNQEELATRLGKSRSAIANVLRLLQLPIAMQSALRDGEITSGHARALLSLTEPELQEFLFDAIVQRQLSVRDAEAAVVHWKRHGSLPAGISGAPAPKKVRTDKPAVLKIALRQLRGSVHPKATISGSERLGRITLPYESEEQLATLLNRLGLDNTGMHPVFFEEGHEKEGERESMETQTALTEEESHLDAADIASEE